jgi:hypothetical protein
LFCFKKRSIFESYNNGCSHSVNLKTDYREFLSNRIAYELEDNDFKECSKDAPKKIFCRARKLPFKLLILFILSIKSSLQRDLDRFFGKLNNSDFSFRNATKGAFSRARQKLNPWAFQRLNELAVETFYQQADYYLWGGHRVLSIDGTTYVLPNHPTVKAEFGEHHFGPKADSKRSLATGSMLYDVLNHITLDANLASYTTSEKDLLLGHLDKTLPGDLLLLDRGYPSIGLFFLLRARGLEFCVRMKEDWWLQVRKFSGSDLIDGQVVFTLPKKDKKMLADYPHFQETTITCRLIKVVLENGQTEILCTSLLDTEKYPHDEFCELYHYRWNEEEAYKLLKCRAEVENFSGKTAISVKQDFHAKIFMMSLCAAYAFPIEEKVRQEYKADENRKHNQKINRTNALAVTQDILIGMFIKHRICEAIRAFDSLVKSVREIIRPGRSVPRNKKPKRPFSMNYKRL